MSHKQQQTHCLKMNAILIPITSLRSSSLLNTTSTKKNYRGVAPWLYGLHNQRSMFNYLPASPLVSISSPRISRMFLRTDIHNADINLASKHKFYYRLLVGPYQAPVYGKKFRWWKQWWNRSNNIKN